ncbi:hypothetical protein Cni_G25447 [Canna indica]|uniref:WEB family protein n=1 Tax=Canna indica TaxID=4628 RepID=A0AAQ3KXQ7_9LILI|nr:hypothetical protein Cni_G25447 [Canna indica]
MFSSKSKSGLSDASINKGAPATPRAGRLGRAGSAKADPATPSPQQSARLSIDRSPKSVESKPTIEHRSPKITTPDKQTRGAKGSELQAQLSALQDELKKVKERLASVEKEKGQILEELKYAKRSADDANDRLQDALVAQRIAEESSEIDKFRADELEQAGIDAQQKKEEEWQKELEIARNQHAVDVAALLATTQELQRAKHELAMTTEAKNSALNHADDAMKIAEINADKVDFLSKEVVHLKALLDSANECKNNETSELAEKGAYLEAQLNLVQEDLKKANEQLASVEEEKLHILEELKEAKRLSEESNEKLKENLETQKRAEEALETYKTHASELEQERIQNSQKREEEWQKRLESLENQHSLSAVTLVSTTEELEKVKLDLRMAIDAKNTALAQACDATMSAEINAEKLELLSGEVSHLKALVDSKKELESELVALKSELEKAKATENKLIETESLVEALKVEVSDAKKAESDARYLVDEWKKKAEQLEVQLEETNELRKTSLETIASVTKQLEESNAVLQDKECEVAALTGKVESLNLEVARHKTELDESTQQLDISQQEAAEMGKMIAVLKSELKIVEEAKNNAVNNEEIAISNIESLTEEKTKLENELDYTLGELENVKKAMEGLASALHEVSTEARETQEKFITKQSEVEDSHAQIEELKMIIKKNQESYEVMLETSKHEIVCLQDTIKKLEREFEESRSEWDLKAHDFASSIRRSEEEVTTMKANMDKLSDSMKEAELRVRAAKEDELQLMDKLQHIESEASAASKVAEEAKAESLRLKEMVLDKENELQSVIQDNDDLKIREAAALEKVQELSSLLAEAAAKKPEENGETPRNIDESDLTISVDFPGQNSPDEKSIQEVPSEKVEEHRGDSGILHEENWNNGTQEKEQLDTEGKICENGKTMDEDFSSEREHETESTYNESDAKMDGVGFEVANGLSSDNMENGAISPSKQQQQQKKKKAFMQKFGSLLKKKNNHK